MAEKPLSADVLAPINVLVFASPTWTQVDEIRWFLDDAHNEGVRVLTTALGQFASIARRYARLAIRVVGPGVDANGLGNVLEFMLFTIPESPQVSRSSY